MVIKMAEREDILHIFPEYLRTRWLQAAASADTLQEIRLRVDRPAAVVAQNRECYLSEAGRFTDRKEEGWVTSYRDLEAILNHVCSYSLYAYEEELRQGFVTLPGGHRVGVAGQVVMEQEEQIRNIKYIRYLHIRIAHEVRGAADPVLPYLYQDGSLCNTLILSPPGCGKTTLLRDLIRQVSDGNVCGRGRNVGVVDERSEIAGSYMGIPQNDVGSRTDVMDACPKVLGMMMLIRSMGPEVVAVDEIGTQEDKKAICQVLQCGSRILATMHGSGMEDVRERIFIGDITYSRIFDRYVLLARKGKTCVVQAVYDRDYSLCSG